MNCDNYNNNNDFITKSYDIKIYTLVIIIIKIEIQTKNNNILNIYNDKSIDLTNDLKVRKNIHLLS